MYLYWASLHLHSYRVVGLILTLCIAPIPARVCPVMLQACSDPELDKQLDKQFVDGVGEIDNLTQRKQQQYKVNYSN